MRHMEERTDGTAHAMDDSHARIVKGDTRLGRGNGHLGARLNVFGLGIARVKMCQDTFDGTYREGVAHGLHLLGRSRFERMAQSVNTRVCRDARRRRACELRVHNGNVGQNLGTRKEHLDALARVVDDCELRGFRTRARRSGDGHKRRTIKIQGNTHLLVDVAIASGHHGNGLHSVDGTAAAKAHVHIAARCLECGDSRLDHDVARLARDLVEHLKAKPRTLKGVGHRFAVAKLDHHGVGHHKSLGSQTAQDVE